MLEQVLLYCELVRCLKGDFIERLKKAKRYYTPDDGESRFLDAALGNLRSQSPVVIPIVVVDRWGNRQNRTAKFTLQLLNKCLEAEAVHRQKIQVFAIGGKNPERVDEYYT